MKTVCPQAQCVGCMACVDACKFDAITIQDDLKEYNAIIDTEKCVSCGACERACQINNEVEKQKPIFWRQGWINQKEVRTSSASGGVATALVKNFLQMGVVFSCVFINGGFFFEQITNENYKLAQGSKYVKSNPLGVYEKIRQHLKSGNKVLFIGLPCQVAALKLNFKNNENLYTVDLICHGSPSPKILDKFLSQYNKSLETVKEISFRYKSNYQIMINGKSVVRKGCLDAYSLAFLEGLSFTENCYQCKYACEERVGDLTLGDSWGSELTNELFSGVSLVLCQNEKGEELLSRANVELLSVDQDKAMQNNHQLKNPSQKPHSRDKFFKKIIEGKSLNKTVFCCLPKQSIKQKIKSALIWLKIKK